MPKLSVLQLPVRVIAAQVHYVNGVALIQTFEWKSAGEEASTNVWTQKFGLSGRIGEKARNPHTI